MVFVNKAGSSTYASQLFRRIESQSNQQVSAKISRGHLEFTSQSSAWSLSIDGLREYKIPSGLELIKWDVIASLFIWHAGGHVETGGDESVTHLPVAKN